jgi:hypothetical protein
MNQIDPIAASAADPAFLAFTAKPVSAQEWESHFNPRAAVPGFASYQEQQSKRSAAFRAISPSARPCTVLTNSTASALERK